ncbi:hypothetical protein [Burkholderia glumae]
MADRESKEGASRRIWAEASQFFQARALFDVIEDEVEHEERAYYLANVGRELTQDAAREVEALYNDEGPKHG